MMMGIDEKPYVNESNQIVPIERHGVKVMSLGLPHGRRPARHLARPDGHEGRRAVPPGRRVGRARLPRHRPAAGDRGRPADADPEDPALGRRHRDDAAGRVAHRRAQGAGDVPEGQRAGPRDRREHVVLRLPGLRPARGDLQARGRRAHGPRSSRCRSSGRFRSIREVTAGGDSGRPIVAGEPKSAVAEAYMRIAESVAKSVGV